MRTIAFILTLLLSGSALHAQQSPAAGDYKPMAYSTRGSSVKKDAYIKRLAPTYLSADRRYIAEWNAHLYSLYQSYGEASKRKQFITEPYVMKYLQNVLQRILDSNHIRQKIEVVPTRYAEPNAYNMGDNRLFVNIGVLGLLDNEAQLAFLLCHELSHQLLHHVQEKFSAHRALAADKAVKKEMRDIRAAKYNKLDRSAQFAMKYSYTFAAYSRAKEHAADSMAIVLLQKSTYDIHEGEELLEILKRSDTDSTHIDYTRFLGSTATPLRRDVLQDSRYAISFGGKRAIAYEEDSIKSHPDIPQRKAFISAVPGRTGGEKFVVSRPAFDSIKAAAAYEIIESFDANDRYAAGVYHTLSLLQHNPRNSYLVRKAAFGLRDIVVAVRDHDIQNHVPIESDANSPAYNQLLRIIDRTTFDELKALYFTFLDRYSEQLTAYPELRKIDEKAKS
jgi:Zn-dependent protease with chaperone function